MDEQSVDEQSMDEQSMDEQSEPIQWQIQSKNINDKNDSLNKENCLNTAGKRNQNNHMNNRNMGSQKKLTLKLFATNAAGLVNGKVASLKAGVTTTNAIIVAVQETHFRQKGI